MNCPLCDKEMMNIADLGHGCIECKVSYDKYNNIFRYPCIGMYMPPSYTLKEMQSIKKMKAFL